MSAALATNQSAEALAALLILCSPFILGAILCGLVAHAAAKAKGNDTTNAFVLGFFLGPLGIAFACVQGRNEFVLEQRLLDSKRFKRCPYCIEPVRSDAIRCRYCGTTLRDLVKTT